MTTDSRAAIAELMAECEHDPLGYVLAAFPWGVAGTELANDKGPREWQRERLEEIGAKLKAGKIGVQEAIQIAVASGHGIGKSALVAWVILWALSTKEDTRVVITANTAPQLAGKTWPELSKWYRMALNRQWFVYTATAIYSADKAHEKTWRADAVPWSKHRSEAFAGLHNKGKRIVLIFDEASAIDDIIWEVSEGALTDKDTEIIWLAFGNPTRNSGRFKECFGRLAHRWSHKQIDARTVEGTNRAQQQQWIEDYGDDHDFVRVRVTGKFPRVGSLQLIPSDVIEAAALREPPQDEIFDALVMAVDVARFGPDEIVVAWRRGRNARAVAWEYFRNLDTMQLAARCAMLADKHKPDVIFVDETGVGAGVVDRLRQMGYFVVGVNNGNKPDQPTVDGERVVNKGAECWCAGRSWLKSGGCIPDDSDLKSQLESREYGYDVHNQIVLERKDDMKKRGLSSPDRADALMLTFALPVQPRSGPAAFASQGGMKSDYDPLEER